MRKQTRMLGFSTRHLDDRDIRLVNFTYYTCCNACSVYDFQFVTDELCWVVARKCDGVRNTTLLLHWHNGVTFI
jgi:hypothetical protein